MKTANATAIQKEVFGYHCDKRRNDKQPKTKGARIKLPTVLAML